MLDLDKIKESLKPRPGLQIVTCKDCNQYKNTSNTPFPHGVCSYYLNKSYEMTGLKASLMKQSAMNMNRDQKKDCKGHPENRKE